MGIGIRRIILIALSIAAGIGMTFGLLLALDVSYDNYGTVYFVFTALPLAVLVGIWLDYFLKTKLLSDGPQDEAKPAEQAKAE